MRLRIAGVRTIVKKELPIEFAEQDITSYGGLELFARYFRLLGLHKTIRDACRAAGVRSDYGCVSLALLVVGMLSTAARRLEQLKHLREDPLLLLHQALGSDSPDRDLSQASAASIS